VIDFAKGEKMSNRKAVENPPPAAPAAVDALTSAEIARRIDSVSIERASSPGVV
jgi:hypothetical protein